MRHKLFRIIIIVALVVWVFSLYDMFRNESAFEAPVLISYAILGLLALVLYLGYKPQLDEQEPIIAEEVVALPEPEPMAAMEPERLPAPEPEEAVEVVEMPRHRLAVPLSKLEGPHTFKCPFCSQRFALEATHIQRKAEFRLACPYCRNKVRVPQRPYLTKSRVVDPQDAGPSERGVVACTNCGEVLRLTAPGSRLDEALSIETCPHCRSRQIMPATAA